MTTTNSPTNDPHSEIQYCHHERHDTPCRLPCKACEDECCEPARTTAPLGSISSGTLRPEDLIPCFLSALDDLRERRTFEPSADAPERVRKHALEDERMGAIERRCVGARRSSGPGSSSGTRYFESDECARDLEWLTDKLGEFAPDGAYFGANKGNGSDFGFWPMEKEMEESKEHDFLL